MLVIDWLCFAETIFRIITEIGSMANRLIYKLSELGSSYVSEAGGKCASLGELMRAQAPVPPGLVVTSSAFQKYLS